MNFSSVTINDLSPLIDIFKQVGFEKLEITPTIYLSNEDKTLRIYVSMEKFHKIQHHIHRMQKSGDIKV